MKHSVTFERDGLRLVGNLFTPDNFDENGEYKALIVQGSLTSVKEQMPELYAQKFADVGFVALAFDYSHYGESDGEPRQYEVPAEKLSDLEAASEYLTSLPYVRALGMVGICTSGGNSAYLATGDTPIQALATVAGMFPEPALMEQLFGEAELTRRREAGAAAKLKYKETGEQAIIPAYSETDKTAANSATVAGYYDYYLNKSRGGVPQWKNEFAVMSWQPWLDFDPISKASGITIPTMVVHSDGCAFPDQAKKFFAELQGEKELVWADGKHFDYYDNPQQVDNAVENITRFFDAHLA